MVSKNPIIVIHGYLNRNAIVIIPISACSYQSYANVVTI